MSPSDLKSLLEPYGIRPIKARGQHFLLDEGVVRRMVDAAGVREGDRVVEIGPGPGILTAELLSRGAFVSAVELDIKLAALLEARFGGSDRFRLLRGDALMVPNEKLASASAGGAVPYKVVANIPYAITSPLIEKFLLGSPAPSTVTLMIQKEVADRVVARPGDMSALSVFAQALAETSKAFDIAPGAFYPPPKVRSSVIHMRVRTPEESAAFFKDVDRETFFGVVRSGFSQKRKQLKNSLRSANYSEKTIRNALAEAKIPDRARPEELGLEDWSRLLSALRVFAEE